MPIAVHQPQIDLTGLQVDHNSLAITSADGSHLTLRRKESQILRFLLNHRNQVINKFALQEILWNYQTLSPSNSLEVHLSSLRRKLSRISETVRIETVRGVGYRLTVLE